jgi:hypothetical protein
VSVWWYVVFAFLTLSALFCVACFRALPKSQNSSNAITRYERFRGLRQVLDKAFKLKPADPAMDRILDDLDRAD